DFSGYATKANTKCTDGRTILPDAFKGNDGQIVPLVWHHFRNEPGNVLGHGLLENRADGVYVYAFCNQTPNGINAKQLVEHGDIISLSIYANEVLEKSHLVQHGNIREVSLVMTGANPGAYIDNVTMSHSDGTPDEDSDDEIVIHMDQPVVMVEEKPVEVPVAPKVEPVVAKVEPVVAPKVELVHATTDTADTASTTETVGDIINTFTNKQKAAFYAILDELSVESVTPVEVTTPADANPVAHSDENEGELQVMKTNVFDNKPEVATRSQIVLKHDQFEAVIADAKKFGSLKTAVIEHADGVTYGIENIDYLFPDAQVLANTPAMLSRRMEWVTAVLNGCNHSPFSTVKTVIADITADEARARGYVKGSKKTDEVIKLLKRVTTAKTIYKKQTLDRDDVIDITDMDVIAWMKAEMRVMLDEELARAVLVTDGRTAQDPDKIDEDHIRSIWKDDDMYAHHVRVAEDTETDDIIDAIIRARTVYNGSGSPTLFTNSGFVSDMLLLKDTLGRRIYMTQAELQAVLRVSNIVEVPVMTGLSRESDDDVPVHLHLIGIVVNLRDYTLGANKGGQVSMFDDFDINYNKLQYLIETRVSGALTLPKSALVIEQV
ncbi:MAG TPA: hypothetical protein VIJ25_04415, partial [Methylococcales bacterium]